MTEIRYMDREGAQGMMQDMHELKSKCKEVCSYASLINGKEKELIEHVERNGGKVLSIISQPISKRRYKRKVAKMIKRNEKITTYNKKYNEDN